MTNKKYIISFIFVLSIFLSVLFYADYLTGNPNNNYENIVHEDFENIENLIIIDGLNDNESQKSDTLKGMIIYDDSIDKNIKESVKDKKNKILEHDIIKPDVFLKKMRVKDRRWHYSVHNIKSGENLWSIAQKYQTPYKFILKVNHIRDPKKLKPGNEILIPNTRGIYYKIKKGDTLLNIAKKNNISLKILLTQNSISKNNIKAGSKIYLPDVFKEKVKTNIENTKSSENYAENYENNSGIKFFWPLKGKINSSFGERKNPLTNERKFHCGLDISADIDTPVKASADGSVIFSGWKEGYGRVVILKHANGFVTIYSHNRENSVQINDKVKSGDIIAYSGMSGAVTGPHLHYEIRKYLTPLNPIRLLD